MVDKALCWVTVFDTGVLDRFCACVLLTLLCQRGNTIYKYIFQRPPASLRGPGQLVPSVGIPDLLRHIVVVGYYQQVCNRMDALKTGWADLTSRRQGR